jgi:oxalate decarboxylase
VGSAGLATAALASLAVNAQERADTEKAEQDHPASNPGPENKPLLDENPNSNFPHRRIMGTLTLFGTPSI